MADMPVVEKLDLHPRHVDPDRALAAAGLARDAEIERVLHRVRRQRVGTELTAEREAKAVRPPARDVLFGERRVIARAHHRLELAALSVVVAHLRRGEETARLGPVERRLDRERRVPGLVAEQRPIIHPRRVHDLARVEEAGRIERAFHRLECAHQAFAEHHLVEFGSADPVSVLAGVRALVFLDDRERLLRDRPHLLRTRFVLHVENRAHMEAADRSVRVPGPLGAVPAEELRQAIGERIAKEHHLQGNESRPSGREPRRGRAGVDQHQHRAASSRAARARS